jgi:hypothetical protein
MRNIFILILSTIFLFIVSKPADSWAQLDYLKKIKKIDVHTHISSDAPYLRAIMDDLNMKMITICTGGLHPEHMNAQIDSAKAFCARYPRYYGWVTTFDLTGRDESGWVEKTIAQLKEFL